jgi:hypothetical protein
MRSATLLYKSQQVSVSVTFQWASSTALNVMQGFSSLKSDAVALCDEWERQRPTSMARRSRQHCRRSSTRKPTDAAFAGFDVCQSVFPMSLIVCGVLRDVACERTEISKEWVPRLVR